MVKKPKITYRVHDPEINHTFETNKKSEVHDYVMDDYVSNSPVHVETLHDGVSQGVVTHNPKDYVGKTHTTSPPKGSKYAFRNNN